MPSTNEDDQTPPMTRRARDFVHSEIARIGCIIA